jgi:dihydrofolate reductase
MQIQLIVAMDRERGIGKNNDLMWHLAADMRFFKETTSGHIVVMGRKNWDSIPLKYRPLSNRENVVLTRNTDFQAEDAYVFHSLEDSISHYDGDDRKFFIIGGGEIYRHALELGCVDEMYITHVDAVYGADTFFPEFNNEEWTMHELFHFEKDEKNEASFTVKHYIRKSH